MSEFQERKDLQIARGERNEVHLGHLIASRWRPKESLSMIESTDVCMSVITVQTHWLHARLLKTYVLNAEKIVHAQPF